MRKRWVILALWISILASVSFTGNNEEADHLRNIYSLNPGKWPAPFIDAGVPWNELGLLPESPVEKQKDSLKQLIELGKMLFFDTRLSSSGKISCATCHQPELNWTDGKEKSIGHEGAVNKRNSPSIQNSWFYNRLFWDGRSKDLQDQAFAPINSESEMHSEMHEVMQKLSRSKGYKEMFTNAFGDDEINPFLMTEAIATFEKTIISGTSRFDDFLAGDKKALTNSELRGLHLFRTKARCMNCHNGPLFSDNQFHNSGFSGGDAGYYNVTHKDTDKGKFKTPSLRDVARTGPWMHDGQFNDLGQIISRYSLAKFPPGEADALLQNLGLNNREQKDLLAFLKAISAAPRDFTKPILPQ
ncbi:MAG: cytochrome-c peroxidase [Chitinophagaceae bacterium]|nr:cytochrome-c peroxidase [Chitinophagaceae bacterium]